MITITAPWMINEETCYKYCSHKPFTQTTITFFNNQFDSHSTNLQPSKLVGGRNQKWNNNIINLGNNIFDHPNPHQGEVMGDLEYVNTLNRFECPITLNPQNASFIEVGIHAVLRQRLQRSTVEKHLRYARYM